MRMVRQMLAGVIEQTLNAYLRLDPELPDLIKPLQGNTLKVSVTDWNMTVFLAPHCKGFSVYLDGDMEAKVQLKGRLFDLIEFALSSHPQGLVSKGKIEQTGDVHILQSYQRFIGSSRVDWEGLLAQLIGDAPAFELCKKAKQLKGWQKANLSSTCQDISEYFQEECRLLPPCEEVEDFYEDIAKLREDAERLEARFNILTSK